MYKYLCVISDNADKKDFHNAVEEVKNCYPDCRDSPEENSDRSCLRRVMTVTEKNVKKTVCIRYDFSDRKVSALSYSYLKKFFKGKKVENISGYSDDLNKAAGIILSIIFIVLNIAASLISFLFELQLLPNLIISAVLAGIYIISAFKIKNEWGISEFKILFIQFGGYITVVIFLLAICFILIEQGWTAIAVTIYGIWFLKTVISALIISLIIQLIVNRIKFKR